MPIPTAPEKAMPGTRQLQGATVAVGNSTGDVMSFQLPVQAVLAKYLVVQPS